MASKKVSAVIKLQCPAGAATPAPPIGPALGPHGVSAPKFVQEFNDRTKNMEKGLIIPVVLTVYLWIHAETQYKEDYEVSKGLLYDKYHDFTDRWIAKVTGDQSFRAIYLQMTPVIDEYDTLLACHKNLYGEDDIYKLYSGRIDRFIQCQEESEKNREEGAFLI